VISEFAVFVHLASPPPQPCQKLPSPQTLPLLEINGLSRLTLWPSIVMQAKPKQIEFTTCSVYVIGDHPISCLVSCGTETYEPCFFKRKRVFMSLSVIFCYMLFLLAPASRSALGPTQPPIQWVPGVLSPGVKRGRGETLTTHPHLAPRLRMSRSYTSSAPHVPPWLVAGQLYFFFLHAVWVCRNRG
jgi:hypothetical protein